MTPQPPGRRAKSRVHGTSPWYERERRAKGASLDRAEKQALRRAIRGERPGVTVEHFVLYMAAVRALGFPRRHLPFITVNWSNDSWL